MRLWANLGATQPAHSVHSSTAATLYIYSDIFSLLVSLLVWSVQHTLFFGQLRNHKSIYLFFYLLLFVLFTNSVLHHFSGSQLSHACQQLLVRCNTSQLSQLRALFPDPILPTTPSPNQLYTLEPSVYPSPPTSPWVTYNSCWVWYNVPNVNNALHSCQRRRVKPCFMIHKSLLYEHTVSQSNAVVSKHQNFTSLTS